MGLVSSCGMVSSGFDFGATLVGGTTLVSSADVLVDLGRVELANLSVKFFGQRFQVGRGGIPMGLGGGAGAGDDGGDRFVVEDPAEGELNHRHIFGDVGFQFIGELNPFFEGEPGEGFSDIKLGSVAVEVAMVVIPESGCLGELAGQQSAGERKAYNDAGSVGLGPGEEFRDQFLSEAVEDDLQGEKTFLLHAEEAFFHGLDAGTEVGNQTLGLEFAKPVEDRAVLEDVDRNAVKLKEVETIHSQAGEGALD